MERMQQNNGMAFQWDRISVVSMISLLLGHKTSEKESMVQVI